MTGLHSASLLHNDNKVEVQNVLQPMDDFYDRFTSEILLDDLPHQHLRFVVHATSEFVHEDDLRLRPLEQTPCQAEKLLLSDAEPLLGLKQAV